MPKVGGGRVVEYKNAKRYEKANFDVKKRKYNAEEEIDVLTKRKNKKISNGRSKE